MQGRSVLFVEPRIDKEAWNIWFDRNRLNRRGCTLVYDFQSVVARTKPDVRKAIGEAKKQLIKPSAATRIGMAGDAICDRQSERLTGMVKIGIFRIVFQALNHAAPAISDQDFKAAGIGMKCRQAAIRSIGMLMHIGAKLLQHGNDAMLDAVSKCSRV